MSLPTRPRHKKTGAPATVNRSGVDECAVIDVSNVTPATTALPEVPFTEAISARINRSESPPTDLPMPTIEAASDVRGRLLKGVWFHPGVAAIHLAFNDHRPLILSPDIIWMFVAQGFANHVNANAEDLRPKLVRHTGKLEIRVRRDDFVKGSPDNPWPDVFDEFATQIRNHIGEQMHDLLLPAFSTTGPVEKAAAQIVLLDAMQAYFDYWVDTICGIPQVLLEGTSADWQRLTERTAELGRFGLTWWTEPLLPILEEFVAAAHGRADPEFWRSIYKFNNESGGPYISGWITAFFPYLRDNETGCVTSKNGWLVAKGAELRALLYSPEQDDRCNGPTTDSLPSGLSKAPFHWDYLGTDYEMEFLAGFVGVRQNLETLSLRPEIGWGVREAPRRSSTPTASG